MKEDKFWMNMDEDRKILDEYFMNKEHMDECGWNSNMDDHELILMNIDEYRTFLVKFW